MLQLEDYKRYGRQMILPQFGLPGQEKICNASVCVVGAGGLGCPALQYLAAAGVGRIGIVDDDVMELSNLQRQILHTEQKIGVLKAESAASAIKQLNSRIQVDAYTTRLSPSNFRDILASYDIILDCTDNSPTRYLLSDGCVTLSKPLVSGAALQFDGQLCVYNYMGGPCYRCLFPKPPSPEVMGSCSENGVFGAVTGVIGTLQAMEAVKIIAGLADPKPSLLIYSALAMPPFRSIKLRSRNLNCLACGNGNSGKVLSFVDESDYLEFCGSTAPDFVTMGNVVGDPGVRVSAKELEACIGRSSPPLLVDVRPAVEYGICHLPNSISIPLRDFVANPGSHLELADDPQRSVVLVCRLGNDSQIAANALRSQNSMAMDVRDLIGGLEAWSRDVDQSFPVY